MVETCNRCTMWVCPVPCKNVIAKLQKEIAELTATINKMKFVKNPGVRMIEVTDSSLIESFGYDSKNCDLYIVLNGSEYVYRVVPSFIFTNMVNAQSRGKFYNDNIKGRYDVIKLV